MTRFRGFGVLCLVLAGGFFTGCKERQPERRYGHIRGTAKSINFDTGEVAMDFTHPKKGDTRELKGTVTQDTEITINGQIARLEDVQLGEEVEVTGYITGEGLDQKMIVTKVTIDRVEPIKTTGTTQPATRPATVSATQPVK